MVCDDKLLTGVHQWDTPWWWSTIVNSPKLFTVVLLYTIGAYLFLRTIKHHAERVMCSNLRPIRRPQANLCSSYDSRIHILFVTRRIQPSASQYQDSSNELTNGSTSLDTAASSSGNTTALQRATICERRLAYQLASFDSSDTRVTSGCSERIHPRWMAEAIAPLFTSLRITLLPFKTC